MNTVDVDLNAFITSNYTLMTDAEIGRELNLSPDAVRSRRRRMGLEKEQSPPVGSHSSAAMGAIEQILIERGLTAEDISKVERAKFSTWGVEGQEQTATSIVVNLSPEWDEGPKWPVVQPAAPVQIKAATGLRKTTEGFETAVILPDAQIGYRVFDDGTVDPFQDESAIDIAMQILVDVRPDVVVNLGDVMDFPEWGKYEQEPAFQLTTQRTLDRTHEFLAQQIANAPESRVVYIEGNHDRRLQKYVLNHALNSFGLRQANAPDSWPVMSVPHLLRLDELDVEYVGGYPAGEYWINDNLVAVHGSRVKSNGSTASAVIDDERVSSIFGHVHRIEKIYKTRRVRKGPKFNFVMTPGTLARIDGAVPGTKSSTDPLGRPLQSWENWQQGMAVVKYEPGNGVFDSEEIFIFNGRAIYRDKVYESRVDKYGNPI
jgi:hypothetical protein